MKLALTGCSWRYDNGFAFKQLCSAPEGGRRTREIQIEQMKRAGELDETGSDWMLLVGSCSNSSVQLQKQDNA